MKNFLLLFLFFLGLNTFSQKSGDVVIYSNTGEKFYVVMNGIRQNNTPETNVKVQGLTNAWYSCKVVSANNSFELEKNIPVKFDTLMTYQITGKKGKYKLRYYSETPMRGAPTTTGQSIVNYSPTATTTTTGNGVGTTTTTGTTGVGTTTTTGTIGTTGTTSVGTTSTTGTTGTTSVGTTTTTGTTGTTGVGTTTTMGTTGVGTTTTGTTGVGTTTTIGTTGTTGTEGVNININISEDGRSAVITETGITGTTTTTGGTGMTTTTTTGGAGTTTQQTTSSSTTTGGNGTTTYYEETTTTTTTTSSGTGNIYQDPDMTVTMTTTGTGVGTTTTTGTGVGTTTTTGTTTSTTGNNNTNYNSGNCYMSDADFAAIKKSIKAETFAEDQLRVANLAAKNKCMSVSQIKEIIMMFPFSTEQLAFAKTAYDSCTNKNDYFQLLEVFTFSDDKEDLEKFINSK